MEQKIICDTSSKNYTKITVDETNICFYHNPIIIGGYFMNCISVQSWNLYPEPIYILTKINVKMLYMDAENIDNLSVRKMFFSKNKKIRINSVDNDYSSELINYRRPTIKIHYDYKTMNNPFENKRVYVQKNKHKLLFRLAIFKNVITRELFGIMMNKNFAIINHLIVKYSDIHQVDMIYDCDKESLRSTVMLACCNGIKKHNKLTKTIAPGTHIPVNGSIYERISYKIRKVPRSKYVQ